MLWVVQGLSIMVFISDNEASQHAVNLAVALARQDVDSVHVMHACTDEGSTPDAQKLMARCTQGLGTNVNSEVMVRHPPSSPPLPPPPPPPAPHSITSPASMHPHSSQCMRSPSQARTGALNVIEMLLSSYGCTS